MRKSTDAEMQVEEKLLINPCESVLTPVYSQLREAFSDGFLHHLNQKLQVSISPFEFLYCKNIQLIYYRHGSHGRFYKSIKTYMLEIVNLKLKQSNILPMEF